MDVGNPKYGSQEALVIFDDVFVPWGRCSCGGTAERQGGGALRRYHRQATAAARLAWRRAGGGGAASMAEWTG